MDNFQKDMFELVRKNDIDGIKRLINLYPKLIEEADENGVVPAFIAAKEGHFKLLKFMMEYTRVSMNIYDNKNASILHYCAISDNVECFAYLVERINMDPYDVDINLKSPLDIAIDRQSENIVNYYRDSLNIIKENIYYNPIVTGTYPDPSIVRVGDDYYMVNSSFFLFPCIPIQHSKDLIHWKTIGHGITDPTYIDLSEVGNGRGFWAPDISYSKGKFYITATLRLNDNDPLIRRQIVVSSINPEGPYSKPKFIDIDGIDPSLFTDDDGKRYMLLNRGARIFEISHEGDKVLSEPRMLWYGDNKRAPEAPHLLKHNGYYYCFVSEGGTGMNHQISVSRSIDLLGPYESCPYNPILKQTNPKHPIQRSGHGKLVETSKGEWFIVYLCGRRVNDKYTILGRETSLDRVLWTKDGWPMINNNKGPSGFNTKPDLDEYIHETSRHKTNSLVNRDHEWVFVRTYKDEYLKEDYMKNTLYMIAGANDLSSLYARNVLLKRQTHLSFDSGVNIELDINNNNYEAGMTCYYDTDTYLKYYITREGFKSYLCVKEQIGTYGKVSLIKEIDVEETMTLKIRTNKLERTFYYLDQNKKWKILGKLNNVYYLSDEGLDLAKRFTGAMVGIYTFDPNGRNQISVGFNKFFIKEV